MNTKFLITVAVLAFSLSTGAQASLEARTGGMVYDIVNKITWAADANLFKTQAASNANLVTEIIAANGRVIYNTPNSYDGETGIYYLTSADFNTGTGANDLVWRTSLGQELNTGWRYGLEPALYACRSQWY